MSRRLSLKLMFLLSLLTLLGVVAIFAGARQEIEVGDVVAIETALNDTPVVATVVAPADSVPAEAITDQRGSEIPVWSGLPTDLSQGTGVFPVGLKLSSLGVDAAVVATGVNSRTGQMAVPSNVSEVAWYQFGPQPGEGGSAVLAAHVDLAGQGPGVFFRLREVVPGDIVEVVFSDGSSQLFRIEARTTYEKKELPLGSIFSREGPPVLTLITCGGSFSESTGSYESNVVAYAVPVDIQEPGPLR